MDEVQVSAVLDELIRASRESETCFRAWAEKTDSEELRTILSFRARVCALNEAEIRALRPAVEAAECEESVLNGFSLCRARSPFKSAHEKSLIAGCEAEDSRMLVRYRDALEYLLPPAIHAVLARQFTDLLDQHARLRRVQETRHETKYETKYETKNHALASTTLALSPQS